MPSPSRRQARATPPTSKRSAPTRRAGRRDCTSRATRAARPPTRSCSAVIGQAALEHDIPALTWGIDIGPTPTPFEHAQRLAAAAWGARRTWFLVNGASQGNLAAGLALAHYGDRVVLQRNGHSSTIDALVLSGHAAHVRRARDRRGARDRPLHHAGVPRARAARHARSRRRVDRLADLLRRGRRRAHARRGRALLRRAADRR